MKDYPHLIIKIEDIEYNKIKKMFKKNPDNKKSGLVPLEKEDIEDGLQKNFIKMVDTFNANKSSLPHCLQEAFEKLFEELKNGPKPAVINWKVAKTKKYVDFHFQDAKNGTIFVKDGKLSIGNGTTVFFKESNCGGDADTKIFSGYTTGNEIKNDFILGIEDIYKEKCQIFAKDENGNTIYETEVSGESVMFHEFTHLLKRRFPKLFEDLKNQEDGGDWLEEVTTEMLTEKLFGTENTLQWYREHRYKDKKKIKMEELCNIVCKDKSKCPKKKKKPPEDDEDDDHSGGGSGGGMFTFMDHMDDNFSYFDGAVTEFNLAPHTVILKKGTWREALKLLGGLRFDGTGTARKLREITPLLIIPSGGLAEVRENKAFKNLLEQYLELGGNIIVLTQQYGQHYDVIPGGETISALGWRQDQSCYNNSIYFDDMHPVLSSCTDQRLSAVVDGYFHDWPSSAAVLLNRTKNREAALLHYPHGNGWVVLSSL
ncbi:MAG: hypothetical protein GY757_05560, partial [bacterium]|nr:hypothetical protein [bacterium]